MNRKLRPLVCFAVPIALLIFNHIDLYPQPKSVKVKREMRVRNVQSVDTTQICVLITVNYLRRY